MAQAGKAWVKWQPSRRDSQALKGMPTWWDDLQHLPELWPCLARHHPDLLALDSPHSNPPEQFSYGALNAAIDVTRSGLHALGLRPQQVVALFADNCPRWLIADQAVMGNGAADAVRGATAPVEELCYILEDCGATGLVLQGLDLLDQLELRPQHWSALRFVVLLSDEPLPGNAAVPEGIPLLNWKALQQLGTDNNNAPVVVQSLEAVATLLYTSGTTGRPKGVPLRHRNLLYQLRNLGVAVQPRPGDRALSVLPIWHSYERSVEYFLLACGCSQTYTNIRQLRQDMQQVRPQFLVSVPRLWEAFQGGFDEAIAKLPGTRRGLLRGALAASRFHCLQWRRWRDLDLEPCPLPLRLLGLLSSAVSWPVHALAGQLLWPRVRSQLCGGRLRVAISGGSALNQYVDAFFEAIGIELLVGYGLTETSPVLCCRRIWANRRGSAGQPLPGTELRIVEAELAKGDEVRNTIPLGKRGLVLARGPQVMSGYHRRQEDTTAVLDSDGWFNTGDLGHLLPDGSLVLSGRAKDTIVLSSGENIEPGPLEDALLGHPLVQQVMLVGQDKRMLAALVVPQPETLAAYCQRQGLPSEGPQLTRALLREFNLRLSQRSGSRPDERLCGVALVEAFTMDNGLLTQTLKQRRPQIAQRYSGRIAQLYRS